MPREAGTSKRRIMLRNFTSDLRSVQIGCLAFAALLIAASAAPALASGMTHLSAQLKPAAEHPFHTSVTPGDSSEETIRIPIWIPGFDDVETPLACSVSVKQSSIRARYAEMCRGILRTLPWISPPGPLGPSLTVGAVHDRPISFMMRHRGRS
jgi:hypothetical protein